MLAFGKAITAWLDTLNLWSLEFHVQFFYSLVILTQQFLTSEVYFGKIKIVSIASACIVYWCCFNALVAYFQLRKLYTDL